MRMGLGRQRLFMSYECQKYQKRILWAPVEEEESQGINLAYRLENMARFWLEKSWIAVSTCLFFKRKKNIQPIESFLMECRWEIQIKIAKKLVREHPAALKGFNSPGLGGFFPGCKRNWQMSSQSHWLKTFRNSGGKGSSERIEKTQCCSSILKMWTHATTGQITWPYFLGKY